MGSLSRGAGPTIALVAAIALNLHALPAVAQGAAREFRQLHMGMEVRMVLHAADSVAASRAAADAFGRIAALEDIVSDWRPGSEVRRLGEDAGHWTECRRTACTSLRGPSPHGHPAAHSIRRSAPDPLRESRTSGPRPGATARRLAGWLYRPSTRPRRARVRLRRTAFA